MRHPYRVCVVGLTFGTYHARAWRRLEPRVTLVGIAERDRGKIDALNTPPSGETISSDWKRWHEWIVAGKSKLAFYEDALEMLDKEKPDIVSIAVAPALNSALVCEAAARGIHVVCEKPMATTLEAADRMIAACDKTGVRLSVGHQRRNALHPYVKAKEMLIQGAIGKLQRLTGYWPTQAAADKDTEYIARYGGGNLMFLGTHLFDLFRDYAGDPQWVRADIERIHAGKGAETGVRVWFGFAKGVAGYYEGDSNQGAEVVGKSGEQVCLYGTEGVMRLVAQGRRFYLKTRAESGWREIRPDGISAEEVNDVGVRAAREAFLDWLEGKTVNVTTGDDGRKALEMALGAYESNRLGSIRIAFPLKTDGNPVEKTLEKNTPTLFGKLHG